MRVEQVKVVVVVEAAKGGKAAKVGVATTLVVVEVVEVKQISTSVLWPVQITQKSFGQNTKTTQTFAAKLPRFQAKMTTVEKRRKKYSFFVIIPETRV